MRTPAHSLLGMLGHLLFAVCVVFSGVAAYFGAAGLPPDFGLCGLVFMLPAMAAMTFVALYRLIAIPLVAALEDRRGIVIRRPSVTAGAVISALLPLAVIAFIVFMYLYGTWTGSLRDSM